MVLKHDLIIQIQWCKLQDCTLIVLSPDPDTMYLSVNSTTFTVALWPIRVERRFTSGCADMSHTLMVRSCKITKTLTCN